MREISALLLVVFLCGSFGIPDCFAQQEQKIDFMRMMRSDINRRYHKSENRMRYRAMWDGNGASNSMQPFLFNDDFRKGIGLTEEQAAQVEFMYSKNGTMGHWYRAKAQTNPELAAIPEEGDRLREGYRDNPYGETLTEAEKQAIIANSEQGSAFYYAETQKDVENLLTPEQLQAVRESELALMGENPILNPSMFWALDLGDEQKEQMEAIKKAMEPEFAQIVEELVDAEDALQELKFDLFAKVGIKFDENGMPVDENGKLLRDDREAMEKKMKRIDEEFSRNVELRDRMEQLNERASGFMKRFKFKMLDVLTDEQLARLERIIADPPSYVKNIRDRMQKSREARDKSDDWRPGPDSWRPGDPIPEEYKQERKAGGFPRT